MASDPSGVKEATSDKTRSGSWTPGFSGGFESKTLREAFEQVKRDIESCKTFSKNGVFMSENSIIVPSRFTESEKDNAIYYDMIKVDFSECGYGTSDAIHCKYVFRIHPDLGARIQVFDYNNETQTLRNKSEPYIASVDHYGINVEYIKVAEKPKS